MSLRSTLALINCRNTKDEIDDLTMREKGIIIV